MALLVTKEGGIATITLNRPTALNALDVQTRRELAELWEGLDQDEEVKVAIITGAGRAFCAGLDMKEAASTLGEGGDPAPGGTGRQGLNFLPTQVAKPLIAAVNGPAAGGGLGLVMSSDFAIAAPEAIFTAPYAARGLIDSVVLAQLMTRTTPGWAMWMALSGVRIDAQTALRIGLVNEVVPQEKLLDTALEMAERILANSWATVMAIKEKMKAVLDLQIQAALEQVGPYEEAFRRSSERQEGITAFVEKRRAQFE